MEKLDLHLHSYHSDDGEFTVAQLLELCRQAGVRCLSITDHNTVQAVSQLLALTQNTDIQAISGVELDCLHEGRNFHLLGYGFDHTHPGFAEIDRENVRREQAAAAQKIQRIRELTAVPITEQSVLEAADGRIVSAELLAELLLRRADAASYQALLPYLPGGARSDNPYLNFYWDYFSQGKPAFVPIDYISLPQAVALVHAAGGAAVLAHPGQNLGRDGALLDRLIQTGLDGLEAYSSYHTASDASFFAEAARRHGLFVTCGSDFHGKVKPAISLGAHGAAAQQPAIAAALAQAGVL